VTMQTEVDMRDLLFPKEQGPGLNPNPPREVGTILRGMMAFCRCSFGANPSPAAACAT
jgi:hypothetical protein